MPDTIFTLVLLLGMIATCGAYALVMSLLAKEVNMRWVRGEAILTLVGLGGALGVSFPALTGDYGAAYTMTSILLLILLIVALGIVILHRFFLADDSYSKQQLKGVRVAAIVLLTVSIVHIFALFAVLSGALKL